MFNSLELAGLQAVQEAAMQDTCIRLVYADGGLDDYGMPLPALYTTAETLACGVNENPRKEWSPGGTQVALMDAQVRLPINTQLDPRDRIQITKRFGVGVDPRTYEVLGLPRRGPSGLVVDMRRVT